jgi:hypothetical protein
MTIVIPFPDLEMLVQDLHSWTKGPLGLEVTGMIKNCGPLGYDPCNLIREQVNTCKNTQWHNPEAHIRENLNWHLASLWNQRKERKKRLTSNKEDVRLLTDGLREEPKLLKLVMVLMVTVLKRERTWDFDVSSICLYFISMRCARRGLLRIKTRPALKIEAVCHSETLVFTNMPTRSCKPEDQQWWNEDRTEVVSMDVRQYKAFPKSVLCVSRLTLCPLTTDTNICSMEV